MINGMNLNVYVGEVVTVETGKEKYYGTLSFIENNIIVLETDSRKFIEIPATEVNIYMTNETIIKGKDKNIYLSWGYVLLDEWTETYTTGEEETLCYMGINE